MPQKQEACTHARAFRSQQFRKLPACSNVKLAGVRGTNFYTIIGICFLFHIAARNVHITMMV